MTQSILHALRSNRTRRLMILAVAAAVFGINHSLSAAMIAPSDQSWTAGTANLSSLTNDGAADATGDLATSNNASTDSPDISADALTMYAEPAAAILGGECIDLSDLDLGSCNFDGHGHAFTPSDDNGGSGSSFSLSDSSIDIAAIQLPEPGTIGVAAIGVFALLRRRRQLLMSK